MQTFTSAQISTVSSGAQPQPDGGQTTSGGKAGPAWKRAAGACALLTGAWTTVGIIGALTHHTVSDPDSELRAILATGGLRGLALLVGASAFLSLITAPIGALLGGLLAWLTARLTSAGFRRVRVAVVAISLVIGMAPAVDWPSVVFGLGRTPPELAHTRVCCTGDRGLRGDRLGHCRAREQRGRGAMNGGPHHNGARTATPTGPSAPTFERLRLLLADQLAMDPDEVKPDTVLLELADRESLDVLTITCTIEAEFNITFGDELDWIRTVQDAADVIDGKRLHPRLPRPAAPPSAPPQQGREPGGR